MSVFPITRAVRPDDFGIIAQIPEISGVARDEDTRMIWCTDLFVQWARQMRPVERMIGSTLSDALPPLAAHERAEVMRRVMETGRSESHYQLSRDRRLLVTVLPLDEEAFGHRGILGVVREAPFRMNSGDAIDIPVLSTPNLMVLDALSLRELEMLHYVATGMKTKEIGDRLFRAAKTVEHHIKSIHEKLGTHSRAQLVRWASERGIQSFTDEEWSLLVDGARRLRKEKVQMDNA